MKKSELKRIIREEMGLPQPPVQVKKEKDNPDRIKGRTIKNVPPSIKQEPDKKVNEVNESSIADLRRQLNIHFQLNGNVWDEKAKELSDKIRKHKHYKGDNINEVMVGGENIPTEVVSAIMAAVPTIVALGAAINWKEEIAAWIKGLKAKYSK